MIMLKYLHFYLASAVLLFLGGGIQAQENIDYIFLLNGKEIKAVVESVDGKFIQYRDYEQPGGATLRIAKTDADRVKLANGTELWYNRIPAEARPEEEAATPAAARERKKKRPVSAQKLQRQR